MTIRSVNCPEVNERRVTKRHWSRWLRLVVAVALLVAMAVDFSAVRAVSIQAARAVWQASGSWILVALGLSLASMVAFGLLRQRTVHAAGGRLPLREAVAVSYAAAAIHLTAPAGVVPSTAYAFHRLQRHGVAPAAVARSLTVSGIVSSMTLVVVGLGGSAIERPGSPIGLAAPAIAAAASAILVVIAVRHPAAVGKAAAAMLRPVNRLLRRPVDAGTRAVRQILREVAAVHPTRADWPITAAAALANWLLDLLCLWACAESLGIHLPPWILCAAYALAMAGAGVSPLPAGVGVVDGIIVLTLTVGGHAAATTAIAAVVIYRVISVGTILVGGWESVAADAVRGRHTRRSAPGLRRRLSGVAPSQPR